MGQIKVYSICIPVLNMVDTVERALQSLIDQIDDSFEIVVVDDGSNDGTQRILRALERRHPNILKCVYLKRVRSRLLGTTRNISIANSTGQHILLHIDADDVWEPYLHESIKIYHQLSALAGRDILMAGNQLHIISRKLALETGPYRNVGRCEDRDMWQRQLRLGNLVWVKHEPYRMRLERPVGPRWRKAFRSVWGHETYSYRSDPKPFKFLFNVLRSMWHGKYKDEKLHLRVLRLLYAVPIVVASTRLESLPQPDFDTKSPLYFGSLADAKMTFRQHCHRLGWQIPNDYFSKAAKDIFDRETNT